MDNLKEQLRLHYQENRDDYDPEETEQVLGILDACGDTLEEAGALDIILLQRMVDDSKLHKALEKLLDNLPEPNKDPFA